MPTDNRLAGLPAQQRGDLAMLAKRIALVANQHDLNRMPCRQRNDVLDGVDRVQGRAVKPAAALIRRGQPPAA